MAEGLAAIWKEVLGVARVGARDDFFELGGHSLLATRVISRVQKQFHVAIPLRVAFEARTLHEFAQRIDLARQAQPSLRAAEGGTMTDREEIEI